MELRCPVGLETDPLGWWKRDPFFTGCWWPPTTEFKGHGLNHLVFGFSTIPCSKETTLGYRGHSITNPNNALVLRKTPQIYHRFALFDPPVKRTKIGPLGPNTQTSTRERTERWSLSKAGVGVPFFSIKNGASPSFRQEIEINKCDLGQVIYMSIKS